MAQANTNASYITDVDELYELADRLRILELATDDPDLDPDAAVTPDAVLDRITRAMNYGKNKIDNGLRNVYSLTFAAGLVETVTLTSPGDSVKMMNAQWAEFYLVRKRLPLDEQVRIEQGLNRLLHALNKADANEILGDSNRDAQTFPAGAGSTEAPDLKGRESIFDGISGAPWADSDTQGKLTVDRPST